MSTEEQSLSLLEHTPLGRGFQSWLNHRIDKGKFDHLGGMKEKESITKLFEQLQFATGSEKKRLLTEMSDYGVNIMRDKFLKWVYPDKSKRQFYYLLSKAQAARLKADKDSLKVFGRMRMVKYPVMDSNGEKIRLSIKLRFGIFFQLVGKGFIK